jgi:hypothetical protein
LCNFSLVLIKFQFQGIHEGRQAARQIDLDLMGYSSLAGPAGIVQPKRIISA